MADAIFAHKSNPKEKSYAMLHAQEIIKKWPFLAMKNADYQGIFTAVA